jgi:hypothetical protein
MHVRNLHAASLSCINQKKNGAWLGGIEKMKLLYLLLVGLLIPAAALGDGYPHKEKTPPKPKGESTASFVEYPVLNPGQTEYVIQPGDAKITMEKLHIPSGVTLKAAPGVTTIEWYVETIVFGPTATIDLSTASGKPGKASNGPLPPGQAGYCTKGAGGGNGQAGAGGPAGASLTLRDVRNIENQGSLWIKTDGGPGGDGGDGGRGQQGGGPDHRFLHGCDAEIGGPGGNGGGGGAGGPTSPIKIVFRTHHPNPHFISGCSQTCDPSTRPPGASGNSGVVAIWGSPGCGGTGGAAGIGGAGGEFTAGYGPGGGAGGSGPIGACTPVSVTP